MERIQLTGAAFDGKSMTDLYQHILDQAGIDWSEDMTFDCRKIEVSRDIQDRAYEAFSRNTGAPEEQINM